MSTATDLIAAAAAIALVSDANTKAALNALLLVSNDIVINTDSLSVKNSAQAKYPAGFQAGFGGTPAGVPGAIDGPNPVVPASVYAAGDASYAALTITTGSTLISGVHGVAYGTTLVASGGAGTNIWSAVSLPAGLFLSTGGVLSGTVAAAGNYVAIATVTNASGSHVSKQFLIAIV